MRALAKQIKQWAYELGFDQAGISDTDLSVDENYLNQWLAQGFHGEMDYMASMALNVVDPIVYMRELHVLSLYA